MSENLFDEVEFETLFQFDGYHAPLKAVRAFINSSIKQAQAKAVRGTLERVKPDYFSGEMCQYGRAYDDACRDVDNKIHIELSKLEQGG